MFCGFLCAVKPCAKCTDHTQVGIVDRGTRVLFDSTESIAFEKPSRYNGVCVCRCVCVCVWVCALRENVNVVMNPERTLVIGAIDRNHLMSTDVTSPHSPPWPRSTEGSLAIRLATQLCSFEKVKCLSPSSGVETVAR